MATSEEIEKYCRNCVSRDFVNGKGLVCKRTRELPAFEEECEKGANTPVTTGMIAEKIASFRPSLTESMIAEFREDVAIYSRV